MEGKRPEAMTGKISKEGTWLNKPKNDQGWKESWPEQKGEK